MTILVTGNQGYIGSVLTELLNNKGYEVVGFDSGYYDGCELYPYEAKIKNQIKKDIRDVSAEDLKGIEAIIHLAALSNDPLGELAPGLTEDINFEGTIKLATLAKEAGIKRFVYASSQSMYGISKTDKEVEEENSEKNPLTSYAKTKWDAECELRKMNSLDFTVVCFRPSTVFGLSPRIRFDIVFNNLVACAFTTGKIEIKSDGSPWRPAIHVQDVSNAFIAGLEAPENLVSNQSFNVGNGNYTVKDLAIKAQKAVPGSSLVFTGEHGSDSRTYKVSFKKIAETLKNYYTPEWSLERGAKEMVECFKKINLSEEQFRGRGSNRLKQIKYLLDEKQLDENLRWK